MKRARRGAARAVVLFGVLDDLVRAFERSGASGEVVWSDRIWFREGRGAPFWIRPAPPPGPLRFGPDLSRFRALEPGERLAAQRALARIVRERTAIARSASLAACFRERGVPARAVDRLFRPLVELAFDRPLELVPAIEGEDWLRRFFSRSARAARMGVLRMPRSRPAGRGRARRGRV